MARYPCDRRGFLRGAVAAGVASSAVRGRAAPDAPAWLAGTGRAEITPPLDVGILMSSGRQAWEPFEGVRLPLWARAVVIGNGRRRVALVALDLLGLAGEAVGGREAFKRRVVAAAGGAVQPEDLILACSHTHSGPESIALTDLDRTEPFRRWVDLLARRIGAAVSAAAGAMRPATLETGVGSAAGLCVNRRILTERGIASVRRIRPDDKVLGPEGPVDESIHVALLSDASRQPIAVLVNATAHPVYEMCLKQISPDYPGEMALELLRRHPQCEVLFLQGAAGNINPPNVSSGADDARQHGRRLAEEVQRTLGQLRPVAGAELAVAWQSVPLPARTITGQAQEQPIAIPLGGLRLGSAAWVFLPGEPFVELALAIRQQSPYPWTAVAGYADDYLGYIPTDRAFAHRGYETGPGRWSRFAAGSEALVCRGAADVLRALAKPTS